jgi:hypothetical protein
MIESGLCDTFKLGVLMGMFQHLDDYRMALYRGDAELSPRETARYTPDGEVVGPGYEAGGMSLGQTIIAVENGVATMGWETPSWPNASFEADGCLIYNASMPEMPAVCVVAFGQTHRSSNGPFTPQIPGQADLHALITWT